MPNWHFQTGNQFSWTLILSGFKHTIARGRASSLNLTFQSLVISHY